MTAEQRAKDEGFEAYEKVCSSIQEDVTKEELCWIHHIPIINATGLSYVWNPGSGFPSFTAGPRYVHPLTSPLRSEVLTRLTTSSKSKVNWRNRFISQTI